jgi:hypothetical protein
VNSDLLLIDTTLSQAADSSFQVAHESLGEPRNAIDYELVLIPTKLAVVEMAKQFGYSSIVLKPTFLSEVDAEGEKNYRLGARRAFVCSKKSDLGAFPAETEAVTLSSSNVFLKKIKNKVKQMTG